MISRQSIGWPPTSMQQIQQQPAQGLSWPASASGGTAASPSGQCTTIVEPAAGPGHHALWPSPLMPLPAQTPLHATTFTNHQPGTCTFQVNM